MTSNSKAASKSKPVAPYSTLRISSTSFIFSRPGVSIFCRLKLLSASKAPIENNLSNGNPFKDHPQNHRRACLPTPPPSQPNLAYPLNNQLDHRHFLHQVPTYADHHHLTVVEDLLFCWQVFSPQKNRHSLNP